MHGLESAGKSGQTRESVHVLMKVPVVHRILTLSVWPGLYLLGTLDLHYIAKYNYLTKPWLSPGNLRTTCLVKTGWTVSCSKVQINTAIDIGHWILVKFVNDWRHSRKYCLMDTVLASFANYEFAASIEFMKRYQQICKPRPTWCVGQYRYFR